MPVLMRQVKSRGESFSKPNKKLSALVGPQNQRTWWQQNVASYTSPVSSSRTAQNLSTHAERQDAEKSVSMPDYPRAWFYPELPWGAPVSDFPPQRLRGQTTMLVWEFFLLIWILWISFEIPYRQGFATSDNPFCDIRWRQGLDIFSDVVFLVDILFQSLSAYWRCDPMNSKWFLVDRPAEIRYLYFSELRPWERSLLWDLLAAFPFMQVGCAMRDNTRDRDDTRPGARILLDDPAYKYIMFLQMLRVLKTWRFWKLPETIDRIVEQASGILPHVLSLARLFVALFFTAHYLACIWFYIGLSKDSIEVGWLSRQPNMLPRGHTADSQMYEWVTSIYWATATMTTIGYGDISGFTNSERGFACIAMITGSAFFAWLAGTVTGILRSSSAPRERFQAFIDEVQNFLDVNRFSHDIKHRVLVFYGLKFPTKARFQEDEILHSLPQGLVKKMRNETYVQMIEGVPLFSELTEATKADIANQFQTQLCSAGEELCTEGEEAENLFIIKHGQVLLSHKGEPIHIAQPGEMFGELALFGLTQSGQRMRSARALTECELLKLPYRSLKILIITSNELKVTFRTMVCRWIKMCTQEFKDPNSPIYDPAKLVYITMLWQQGRIPDRIRKPGKVPPPVFQDDFEFTREQEIKHMIHVRMLEIKGLPLFGNGAGQVILRTEIDWFPEGHDLSACRRFCRDREYYQGNDLLFRQFQVLLKFMTKIKKRITYPEVKIKVIFVGAFEGDDQQKLHAGQKDAAELNGVKGVTDPGNYTFSNESGHKRATVAVPFKDTVIAEFSISSKDIFSAAKPSQFEYMTLTSEWHVGGQIGPIELVMAAKVTRELPAGSLLKNTFRPILFKKLGVGAKATEEQLIKWLREIKGGVKNFLSRGDNGKGGASAASVELQLEKNSEEIIARLRDMRSQIDRLDKKVHDKVDAKVNNVHQNLVQRLSEFEDRVMSQIEHIHQALDKRLEAAALDNKKREELILTQFGLNVQKMMGRPIFNFQTPEETLRQIAAPQPQQLRSHRPAHQAMDAYAAPQAMDTYAAPQAMDTDAPQYTLTKETVFHEAMQYASAMALSRQSAREPTPKPAFTWRPPAVISKSPGPLNVYPEDVYKKVSGSPLDTGKPLARATSSMGLPIPAPGTPRIPSPTAELGFLDVPPPPAPPPAQPPRSAHLSAAGWLKEGE